jgi:hypothetical protein
VRALLAACDLPFEAACLAFHQTERAVRTASSEQVRQPIFREGTSAGSVRALARSAQGRARAGARHYPQAPQQFA